MNAIVIIILMPHARYMAGPCCIDHMPQWDRVSTPRILMGALEALDEELEKQFRFDFNTSYLSLRTIASFAEGPNVPLQAAWGMISAKSNIYVNNKGMKAMLDLIILRRTNEQALKNSHIEIECRLVDRRLAEIKHEQERRNAERLEDSKRSGDEGGPARSAKRPKRTRAKNRSALPQSEQTAIYVNTRHQQSCLPIYLPNFICESKIICMIFFLFFFFDTFDKLFILARHAVHSRLYDSYPVIILYDHKYTVACVLFY